MFRIARYPSRDVKRSSRRMPVTHIPAPLQPGLIKVLIRQECAYYDQLFPSFSCVGSFRKRVFILGPSHHLYLESCALSTCEEYETPLGNLPLDLESKYYYRIRGFSDQVCDSYQRAPSYWEVLLSVFRCR